MPDVDKTFKKRFLKNSKFLYIEWLIVIVSIAIFAISIFTTIIHTNTTHAQLEKQASNISIFLMETFDSVFTLLKNAGEDFRENQPKGDAEIAAFLEKTSKILQLYDEDHKLHNLFTLPYFDWQKSNYIIALDPQNPKHYQTHEYKRTLMSVLPDLQKCEMQPWVLHLHTPRIGFNAGLWCLPATVGVTNAHGNFLGVMAIGISVAGLAKKVHKLLESNYYFIVIDKNFRPILQSASTMNPIDHKNEYDKAIFKHRSDFDKNEGELSHPIYYNNIVYSYYKKLNGYDYIILIGFDKNHAWQEFFTLIFPRVLEFICMGLFCLLLLYLSRRRMIKMSREADHAKSTFSQGLTQANSYSIQSILAHSEILLKYFRKEVKINITQANIIQLLENIYKEALNINNLTTSQLNLQNVDINVIIRECIKLFSTEALQKGIMIESDLADNLLPLIGDALRLKQVMASLIKFALNYNPRGGIINIKTMYDAFHDELVIIIRDTGFGLPIQEMERLETQFNGEKSKNNNGFLDLEDTKNLIKLHNGFFNFKSVPGEGNELRVRFRYNILPTGSDDPAFGKKAKSNVYSFNPRPKK